MVMAVLMISLSAEIFCPLTVTPRGGGVISRPAAEVNALLYVSVQSYDERAAARYVLCIRKEVLAMFANRQTPPGVAL
jgi:hypothetical protein